LEQVGRRSITNLTIDDIGGVLGDALRDQRRHIVQHMGRLFRLQQLRDGAANDQRLKNLHRRLIEVEAEIRALKKGGAMNTSVAADALDQGDTDRARTRVRTGRLVLTRPPLYRDL